MQELRRRIPGFRPEEAGKFYSHEPNADTWYYYAYGFAGNEEPENKLASRLIGRPNNGVIAIVRSGPDDSNDYPVEMSQADILKTAAFYLNNSPVKVFREREESRMMRKFGFGAGPRTKSPQAVKAQEALYILGAKYGFQMS